MKHARLFIYSYFKSFSTNNFNIAFIINDFENLLLDPNLKYIDYKDRTLCELGDFQKYFIDKGLTPQTRYHQTLLYQII